MPARRAARSSQPAAPEAARLYVAEPSAAYRVAIPIVVDCSLLGAVLFQEVERTQAAERIDGHSLHAPGLLDYEVANVAVKKARAGFREVAADGVARYVQLPLKLHDMNPVDVYALAERYKLSAYDAAYLWLAAALRAPLATFDRKLAEAAQKHLSELE